MSFQKQQQLLIMSLEDRAQLEKIVRARTSPAHHIERAQIILNHSEGMSTKQTAAQLDISLDKIYRCIKKAKLIGIEKALDDLPRTGRPAKITPENKIWVLSEAARKPKDLGYPHERWTTRLLATHLQNRCKESGHASLEKVGQGTVVQILNNGELQPHKQRYVLERRDPEFEPKTVELLKAYKLTELLMPDITQLPTEPTQIQHNQAAASQSDHEEELPPVQSTPKELAILPRSSSDHGVSTNENFIDNTTQVRHYQPSKNRKVSGTELERRRKSNELVGQLAEFMKRQKQVEAEKMAANSDLGGLAHDCDSVADNSISVIQDELSTVQTELEATTLDQLLTLAINRKRQGKPVSVAVVSYDEKPGIQAIKSTAPDRPPVAGKYRCHGIEHEYERLGTVSLLAGLDLIRGQVHGLVKPRHRSCEFVEFLQGLDRHYQPDMKIVVLLDNHSAHKSKETRQYLSTVPNRFLFVFTPVHSSWLNIIECFFSKVGRSLLRGIRVSSVNELIERIHQYLEYVNNNRVVFRWRFGLHLIVV